MESSIHCKCLADYYNRINTCWEPLIEPWSAQAVLSKIPIIRNNTGVNTEPSVANNVANSPKTLEAEATSGLNANLEPAYASRFTISSNEVLNVNLSKTFFDTMQNCIKLWTEDYQNESKKECGDYLQASQTLIRNETGVAINYYLGSKREHMLHLQHGEEKMLLSSALVSTGTDREAQIAKVQSNFVNIQLEGGWEPIEQLPVNRIGSWVIALKPQPENNNVRIIWSIKNESIHQRKILIQSSTLLCNKTDMPLELRVDIPYRGFVSLPSIPPNDSVCLPLQYATSGKLQIRPVMTSDTRHHSHHPLHHYPSDRASTDDTDYHDDDASSKQKQAESECEWSNVIPLYKTTTHATVASTTTVGRSTTRIIECVAKPNNWFFASNIDRSVSGRQKITISAPLIFENLLAVPLCIKIYRHGLSNLLITHTLKRGDTHQLFHIGHRKQIDISLQMTCNTLQLSGEPSEEVFKESKRMNLEASGTLEFPLYDSKNRLLNLYGDNEVTKEGINICSIYAKYWMINKTGLRLLFVQKSLGSSNDLGAGQTVLDKQTCKLPTDPAHWYDEGLSNALSEPLMYSYANSEMFGNKTKVKVADSKWSKAFSLESVGTDGSVIVHDSEKNSKILFQLGVTIELLSGRFHRTKAITFQPRFILVNRMDRNLYYRQIKTELGLLIPPGKSLPFHWLYKDKPLELCITFSPQHTWSSPFPIEDIAEFAVKIKKKPGLTSSSMTQSTSSSVSTGCVDLETCLARVEIQLHNATFFVIFKPEAVDVPPYRIENLTNIEFAYYQRGRPEHRQIIAPNSKVPYTWDRPGDAHKLTVEYFHLKSTYNLDKIKDCTKIEFNLDGQSYHILPEVLAEGPTRILRLRNDPNYNTSLTSNNPLSRFSDKLDDTITMKIVGEFRGLGLSIIDESPQELLYMSCNEIFIEYSTSPQQMRVEMQVNSLQIDNQLASCTYPVLLSRSVGRGEPDADFFHFSMVKANYYTSILFFDYFSFLLQEMDLRVDDTIINHILQFANFQLNTSNDPDFDKKSNESMITEPGESAKKMYFVFLHINPIKVNITFCYSFRNEATEASQQANNSSTNPVRTILSAIGVTVANIEDAPISLRTLMLENTFHTRPELISRILKHYYLQLLYEMYKIVGSFDIIGNPVSLVHNLGTGVHDFFYEPAKGFVQSPREFVLGVGKGSSSLIKNSVIGIFGTASKITGTLGKGVAHLTFDKDYVRNREKQVRERPKHFGEGMVWGAKELGAGFFHGITGVVSKPISGAKREGVQGFMKGMGKGVIGVAVKPGVGFFDMATRTTQGIKNTATLHDKAVVRVRPPRGFGPDRVLGVYDVEKAIGQSILRSLNAGYFADEWHLFHCISSEENIILVSNKHIFYIQVGDQIEALWRCRLSAIGDIKVQTNAILVERKTHAESQIFQLNMSPSSAQWVHDKLKRTITLTQRFNEDEDDLAFSSGFII